METFTTQRFDGKIDSFESCIIDGTQQQDITQTVVTEANVHEVHTIETEENHDTTTLEEAQIHGNQVAAIVQPNTQQSVTLTPVRLPAILDGEFFNVIRLEDTNVTARCRECQKLLNGNLKSTGNFLSHIKEDCQTTEETFEQTEWLEPAGLKKRKSEDYDNEMLRVSHNNSIIVEDEFDAIGRNVAAKLRHMRVDQRIIAEKLLNDILFEAQLGTLHRDSSIHV